MRIRYTNTHTIADVYELDVPDDELNPDGAFDLSTAQGREDAMNDWADWQGGDPFFPNRTRLVGGPGPD